jgi:hypothetical protein
MIINTRMPLARRPDPAKAPIANLTLLCHTNGMENEIENISPGDEGDGLPNIRFRLRVILASALGSSLIWAGVILLIR